MCLYICIENTITDAQTDFIEILSVIALRGTYFKAVFIIT